MILDKDDVLLDTILYVKWMLKIFFKERNDGSTREEAKENEPTENTASLSTAHVTTHMAALLIIVQEMTGMQAKITRTDVPELETN